MTRTNSRNLTTPYRNEQPIVQSVPGGPSEELLDFLTCCIQIFGKPQVMRLYLGNQTAYHLVIFPDDICERVPSNKRRPP
jgi:hypothetical protein